MSAAKPLLLLAIATSALAACSPSSNTSNSSANATAPAPQPAATNKTSGVDLSYRNASVQPGDDFDEYANGGWRNRTEIPADRSSAGVGYEVFLRAEARTKDLIANAAQANAAAGTPQRLIADYYSAYMDQAGTEARGLSPLQPDFDEIDGIKTRTDLAKVLGSRMRADVDPLNATNFETENLFGLWVAQALDDPSRNVPYLLQGGLGMPDREYYLSGDADMVANRKAYRTYIVSLLKLAGIDDAEKRAARIVALEQKIARVHATREASSDVHLADNPWSMKQLKANAPGLDWTTYLKAAGLQDQTTIVAWHPQAIRGISALVASQPMQAWKDWLTFHTINQNANYLPKAIDDLHFNFFGKQLQGTPQQRDRWKRGQSYVSADLGDAVGKIYAERYFPASSKTQVQDMVKNILAAFDRRVAALTWMTPATKEQARAKIKTLIVGVGYPDSWRDYAGLQIRADDPVGNAERAKAWEYKYQLSKLGKSVDRNEWWMTPQTVNAVNLPMQNALNFPAAILDAPYFDPNADAAANYGSIGSVIGHEISHSFDHTGAGFDAEGKLRNWWTPADLAHFEAAAQQLVKQYNAYTPLPGVHLNGKQILDENMADLAGLAAAYDAWKLSLGGKPAPVIDGLTGDQRFFLAFAQGWRSKIRDQALKQRIITDGHAPAAQRVQTVRNIDQWYDAYAVKPGQKLFLAPNQRVRVW